MLKILLILLAFANIQTAETGTNRGAYLITPDSNNLEYRQGYGFGYSGNGWDDEKTAYLSTQAGYDGQRKQFPENHFAIWGYGIELDDVQTNTKLGILDIVGYLANPTPGHSSNASNLPQFCYPANLYEPIWLEDGSVNPNNYWAAYVNKTVGIYKDYVKIWEVWNEPDYTKNYGAVSDWATNPPKPKDLVYWYGTIFEYIRLQRISYEVAKKIDPNCWVATGGLGYPEFLDAIMRYTDNPDGGKVTDEYPAYGGAYFDCDTYHQYPQYGTTDIETGEEYNDIGSDMLAKKVVILKKSHHFITKKYGFGAKYPDKIFINTETGYTSDNTEQSELVRRNWIIKMALYQIEYDVKQIHQLTLTGDFSNVGKYVSIEEGAKHIKSSSKARVLLKKMNLGKYVFVSDKTASFRKSLPEGLTGIVLKRKFPKVTGEAYYYKYLYSVWVNCLKEEVAGEVKVNLSLPFDPLVLDWQENKKQMTKSDIFTVTNTPIFLLGN